MLAIYTEIVKIALIAAVFGVALVTIIRFAKRAYNALKTRKTKPIIYNLAALLAGAAITIYLACSITHVELHQVSLKSATATGALGFGKFILVLGFAYIAFFAIKELLKFDYRRLFKSGRADFLIAQLFLSVVVISTLGFMFFTAVLPSISN